MNNRVPPAAAKAVIPIVSFRVPKPHKIFKESDRFQTNALPNYWNAASRLKTNTALLRKKAAFGPRKPFAGDEELDWDALKPVYNYQGRTPLEPQDNQIPVLNEMMRAPLMRLEALPSETVNMLRTCEDLTPILPNHVEWSLVGEFGWRGVAKTDWDEFEDPLPSYGQAASVIMKTLAWKNLIPGYHGELDVSRLLGRLSKGTKGKPDYVRYHGVGRRQNLTMQHIVRGNEAWLRQECQTLYKELAEGDYESRWSMEKLPEWLTEGMPPEQIRIVKDAAKMLGCNPTLHPEQKLTVLNHIRDVLLESCPPQLKPHPIKSDDGSEKSNDGQSSDKKVPEKPEVQ